MNDFPCSFLTGLTCLGYKIQTQILHWPGLNSFSGLRILARCLLFYLITWMSGLTSTTLYVLFIFYILGLFCYKCMVAHRQARAFTVLIISLSLVLLLNRWTERSFQDNRDVALIWLYNTSVHHIKWSRFFWRCGLNCLIHIDYDSQMCFWTFWSIKVLVAWLSMEGA